MPAQRPLSSFGVTCLSFGNMDKERLLKLVSAGLMLAFVTLCTCALMYLLVSELDKIQQINQGLIFSI